MASRGINKVILIGNLGFDPEVRQLTNGGVVANVRLATSESWKDKNTGENIERTEWHRVIFFSRLGEIVRDYLKKGSKIYIEGRIQTNEWEDKDGNKRYTTEVVANNMQMLDSRGGAGASSSTGGASQSSAESAAPQAAADSFDDDIPF